MSLLAVHPEQFPVEAIVVLRRSGLLLAGNEEDNHVLGLRSDDASPDRVEAFVAPKRCQFWAIVRVSDD
jgi:hypothetical protein